ncbi:MAG: hypothetical protein J6S85_05435 [Methanobrevibacter sp.]|nr:hypothetical protein [Methanobrevibacter sp.]
MIHGFPIDYVRATFEQTLLVEHLKNVNFYGGSNQVRIFSLYEQLLKGEDVDRYIENFRDLAEQQNRSGLILNGVITAPVNPTITNLYSCTIIPLEYVCSLRCTIENRDGALETINNLIEELKGSKVDIAELKCPTEQGGYAYVPFVVGTIGHNDSGAPYVKNGDYLGTVTSITDVPTLLNNLSSNADLSIGIQQTNTWLYCSKEGKLVVVYGEYNGQTHTFDWNFIENDGTYKDVIFPPEHVSFKKYKMSLSFEAIRCDEPYNLNADEYVKISFGGSATIQDAPIRFGNDLVKVAISKYGIKTSGTPITFNNPTLYWLEPLEMPSGNNPNIRINQLVSNNFKNNTQTDSISVVLQYSFVLSDDIHLLEQWFDYGRYGEINVNSSSEVQTMSPNLIYNVYEIWSYWGKVVIKKKKTRIADSTDIDTTEGDTMTLGITMQVQGDND